MRVLFGAGALAQLPAEVDRLSKGRVLMISTPGRGEMVNRIAAALPNRVVGFFDKAVMHQPIGVVREARELARSLNADCCVAVGGGSTIGFGKAIALDSGLPVV